jgi:hypothetical protein
VSFFDSDLSSINRKSRDECSALWKDCLTGIESATVFVVAFLNVNETQWRTIDNQYFSKSTFPASLLVFVLSV